MISIIIPTLNEEKNLARLLQSIKDQSFDSYEIIVADSYSSDRTRKIARSFGCRLTSVKNASGPAKARNQAAKLSRGKILLFVDADMAFPPGSLTKLFKEFKVRGLDIASCFIRPFSQTKFLVLLFNIFHNWPIFALQKALPLGTAIVLVKAPLFKKAGGFNEEIRLLEDSLFLQKGACYGKYGFLKKTFVFFSERRFQKEGWIKLYLKIIAAFFYTLFFGPIKKDIFHYRFGKHQ